MKSSVIKTDDQKYNLEQFKKRTKKNSNRIIGSNHKSKWNVFNTDQSYSSNLPQIGKTRTNYPNESCPLDQKSIDILHKRGHSKNKLLNNSAHDSVTNVNSSTNTTFWHNSINKKTKINLEKDAFIHNILKGLHDNNVTQNHDYQLTNREQSGTNFNLHKKLLRRRSERGKRITSFGQIYIYN